MAERSHLSIGEVLSLLRQEFPDVTISKIRFLESQGLVDPERTPSGYRKFYDHDVERLRWILRQQREHFLPLKVIRGRLSNGGTEPDEAELEEAEAVVTAPAAPAPAATAERQAGAGSGRSRAPAPPRTPSLFADKPPAPPPPARTASAKGGAGRSPQPAAAAEHEPPVEPAPEPRPPAGPARVQRAGANTSRTNRPAAPLETGDETDSYTAEELATSSGAPSSLVVELEQFGLISARAVVGGVPYFDDIALVVTRTAAEFARHGVEVRHLRSWRNAADREADLFQQIVLPLLRQRNPQARRQAAETLAELARLGGEMRSALVGRAVRDIR